MPRFEPRDPNFEAKVRESFGRQTAMRTLGAVMGKVRPGEVEIEMPYRADLAQQHGFIHGASSPPLSTAPAGMRPSVSAPRKPRC